VKKVLGLDLSSSTGYAVFNGREELVSYGKIVLPKSTPPHAERFQVWREEFIKLCEAYEPSVIVIEELHMTRNLNTMKILCGLLAVTAMVAPEGLEFVMCHQSTAKKDIVKPALGRAKLNKEDVFNWAVQEYDLKDFTFKRDNDITDAILVARWGVKKIDEN
jgi:Holliday junction resolvasome RuvABC endonuclease subunit